MLFNAEDDPEFRDPVLNFQVNAEKTYAYLRYVQGNLGSFETAGNPESVEEYTTSGGSFSAGTGVSLSDLKRSVTEFSRLTNSRLRLHGSTKTPFVLSAKSAMREEVMRYRFSV